MFCGICILHYALEEKAEKASCGADLASVV